MIRRPPRSPLFPYTPLSRSALELSSGQPDADLPVEDADRRRDRTRLADAPLRLEPDRDALARREAVCDQRRLERSEEHTSELQSRLHLVCRLLLEKKKKQNS